jgi:hypothetical protein
MVIDEAMTWSAILDVIIKVGFDERQGTYTLYFVLESMRNDAVRS